jgi:hypothetical protein
MRKMKHGHARDGKATSEYFTWRALRERCLNPKNKWFSDYGGRGIGVCERWRDFKNFLTDMGPRPEGMQIERKDNSKGYEPDNCMWASRGDQRRNTRQTRFISIDEITLCVTDMASLLNFPRHLIYRRAFRHRIDHQAAFSHYILSRIESAYGG